MNDNILRFVYHYNFQSTFIPIMYENIISIDFASANFM